jgi:transposase-like protein
MLTQKNYSEVLPEMKGKRQSYTGSFKAQVVSELINHKRTLSELSEYYNVHPNQIKNWKSLLLKEAKHVLEDKRREKPPNKENGKSERGNLQGTWHAKSSGNMARINISS